MKRNLFLFAVFFAVALSGCGIASGKPMQQGYEATGLAARQGYEVTGLTDVAPGAASDSETGIMLLNVKEKVKRGEDGGLSIQGVPNTDYTVTATYNNLRGTVTAKASMKAGDNGKVTWVWNVKRDTLPGTYRLIVSGGGKMIATAYTVTK